jgi:hypothetical protein
MHLVARDDVSAFVGDDGAIVRELASPANAPLTRHSLAELSHVCGLRRRQLEKALDSVVVLDTERQDQVSHMLQRVAQTFSEMGEERLNLLARLQRISEISTL